MPWICKLVDVGELKRRGESPKPGDMWYEPQILEREDIFEFYKRNILSPEYLRDWSDKRPPICICLPDGSWWQIDSRFGEVVDGHRKPNGWTVTGQVPNLTATPSILIPGPNGYHGWLKEGVLTDDIEGRKYGN